MAAGWLAEVGEGGAGGESAGDALEVVVVGLRGVDAEVVEDGGGEVGGRDGAVGDVAAGAVGGADDLSAADASASEEHRKGMGPMIAAGLFGHAVLGDGADLGRAAELAGDDDERGVE